jgi:AcrR family transcriptional regulator
LARQRTTREEARAATRERLLEAARHVFARGGYGGASVDVIAAEAGYTKGAFYSNFPSKEAVFLALLARHMEREADELGRLFEGGGRAAEVVERLDGWLGRMNADADWALLAVELQLHARRSPDFAAAFEALAAEHRRRLGGYVERLFALSGKALPAPADEIAAALMALAHGLALSEGAAAGPLIGTVLGSLLAAAPPAG